MRILKPCDLEKAARAIDRGQIVVVPTSRWYMICCDAGNEAACAEIFRAKARPSAKQLLLVLESSAVAAEHFKIGHEAQRLIRAFWPGELSLMLSWKDVALGRSFEAVGSEVALVGHAPGIMGLLAAQTQALIASTSANLSMHPDDRNFGPSITLAEVLDFAKESNLNVDVIIDGGVCPQFAHTTVVDCSDRVQRAKIVREGIVHRRAIDAALAEPDPAE